MLPVAEPEPVVVAGPVVQVSEMKATLTVSATPRIIPNSTRMMASQSSDSDSPAPETRPDRQWFRAG